MLIDKNGKARLCDFGLSRMIEETTLWHTTATTAPGTIRWKAPELLSGEQRTVTKKADIYAYGMTCFVSSFIVLRKSSWKTDFFEFEGNIHRPTPLPQIPERLDGHACCTR